MNRSTCNHWNYHVTANRHRIPALAWVAFVACTVCSWNAAGQEMSLADGIPGLLEAYRTVNLSSGESGVLMKIPVVEGQRVKAGDVIAQLDDALQATQLKIAERRMAATCTPPLCAKADLPTNGKCSSGVRLATSATKCERSYKCWMLPFGRH